MAQTEDMIDALDRRVERRDARREFFKAALGMGVMAGAVGFAHRAAAQTITDFDILNFALNLEYLEAQFYSYAVNGAGIETASTNAPAGNNSAVALTGTGTPGTVTGGQRANLTDPTVIAYAREIAEDERNHVRFLRAALTTSAVAQPAINIGAGTAAAPGPFTLAARAAGIITSSQVFDPYANDNNFLLGSYIFEDVGVTAYKGASPLIADPNFLDAAAGILAAEAFHAGLVRSALYARGVATPSLRTQADAISDARDRLDGTGSDLDQGISATGTGTSQQANIVPTDANGITFSRTPAQTLNIVYLTNAAATMGGFFPAGVNGNLRATVAVS